MTAPPADPASLASPPEKPRRLAILGTRGIPANHSGFETLAEFLAPYLVERGWDVEVYCQDEGEGGPETWKGVALRHVKVDYRGSPGSIIFDWRSTKIAARRDRLILTLGYNTAIFCVLYRLLGRRNIMNMDGIEWIRAKWPLPVKAWYYVNEWLGAWLANHLIADHPEIANHLARRAPRRKTTMIPYGASHVESGDPNLLRRFGLEPNEYVIMVCRAEPENSVLDIVSAFSRRARGIKLAVVGRYDFDGHRYHRKVKAAASDEVVFTGGVYDSAVLPSLRFFACLYVHGHRVGGTNPTLIEAMGAGNAVLAHDNKYNRWVAGAAACYFRDSDSCARALDELLAAPNILQRMGLASRRRHAERFTWDRVLREYEALLLAHADQDSFDIRS